MKKAMDQLRKFLCRVAGEETGAVMMEYVILAVLIAAAAVIAIAYFGRTVVSESNVASEAMTGKGHSASEIQQKSQTNQKTYQEEAVENNKKFSDAKEDAAKTGG